MVFLTQTWKPCTASFIFSHLLVCEYRVQFHAETQRSSGMASITVLLLISVLSSSQSESHSLYYTHSAVSTSLTSGEVNEFYNSVELDNIHMSLCNRVNKADFMTRLCEESQTLFNESDDLHYKQQWLQINIKTLMEHERSENSTRDTDVHVLQWRHGCEVERHSNGSVMFLQGTDEYAYDGETLTFDLSVHWKPLVLDHDIIWDRESVSSLERRCVETLTRFTKFSEKENCEAHSSLWLSKPVIGFLCSLFVFLFLTFFQLRKYGKQDTQKTPSLVQLSDLHKTQMKPELKEIRESESLKGPERCEAALHTDSEEENPADPSVEEGHTEDLHDTQSLCETEATAAARGAMGSKNISLPNIAMEREDTDQNTVTQNALLLPLPRRCRSKDISLPNLV